MDETCLSQDEVYTIITNKDGKERKVSLVAIIKGTSSDTVIRILQACLRESHRRLVKEITVDLSPAMMLIARQSFPKATLVNDRFHVQKLLNEAVDELRAKFRWEMMEQENDMMQLAKETGHKYIPERLRNGETKRQLLVRARKRLFKNRSKWTQSQRLRAEILFEYYPQLEHVYDLSMELTTIFNTVTQKGVALAKFARWYDKIKIYLSRTLIPLYKRFRIIIRQLATISKIEPQTPRQKPLMLKSKLSEASSEESETYHSLFLD